MKRNLLLFILIILIIVIIKYVFSNYEFSYKINNYNITTKLNKGIVYFEIENDVKYNFDIYINSKKKIFISDIKELDVVDYKCILPVIDGMETYPLCYSEKENVNVDYNIIDSEELSKYKTSSSISEKPQKDFVYYNNIDDNTYVALWTYRGYILMNSNEYKILSIFNKDRYDNDLAHQINNIIYMPNYDIEHEYNEMIALDIVSQKTSTIKLNRKIDYDSYVVGNIKNKLYIYDNKKSILYEINVKNGETNIISSSEKGYKKYSNGKFIECSKNEYKNDRITFNLNNTSNYKYEITDSTYKMYNNDENIKIKIVDQKIEIVSEYRDNIYYKIDNYFYRYNPRSGSKKIFYDYELSFNNSKPVFVYIK